MRTKAVWSPLLSLKQCAHIPATIRTNRDALLQSAACRHKNRARLAPCQSRWRKRQRRLLFAISLNIFSRIRCRCVSQHDNEWPIPHQPSSANLMYRGGSEVQTSLNFLERSKKDWVSNSLDFEWDLKSGSPTIWNPEKQPPFCQKPFDIWTKTAGFWMVRFSNGWDQSYSSS